MQIPRIHPDTIDEVKQRVDIYDVISASVVLRKRGKDFVGLCPFHEEKSPSFTVSPSKQMYYCFGCGAGGTAINFLMELGKRSFSDVVLDLASRYQIPIQTLEPEQRQALQQQISLREQLYEILAIAANFYEHTLRQPQGKAALEYLQSCRNLSEATIQQFQLGYAPAGWETLYSYLVEQKHFPVQLVEQAGLIIPRKEKDTGYYDRFRDRLMIPIHDIQGKVIGFGGRSLGDELPKYLNSPETELFDKGKTLFGLDKAKNAISKLDQAVVVEGYFDVIALHAAGITNTVAALGTALSLNQVRQLLRYTESKQIILNFDADKAGNVAAERAISEMETLANKGEINLRILNMPDGKDADEFLHTHSPENYQALLANAPLWVDWCIDKILVGKNLKQADHAQQITEAMVKLLSQLEDGNQRTYYTRHCADLLSHGDSRLVPMLAKNLLNQIQKPRFHAAKKKDPSKVTVSTLSEQNLLAQAEGLLLRIYIHCPEHRNLVSDALKERDLQFSLSQHRLLWRHILYIEARKTEPSQLMSMLQNFYEEFPEQFKQISHLFYLDEKTKQDVLRGPLAIRAAAASLERVLCEKRYRRFWELWQQTDAVVNLEAAQYYHQQLWSAKKRIQELDETRKTTFFDLVSVPWVGSVS